MVLGGWLDGWIDGLRGVKYVLRVAYSNQKSCRTSLGLTINRKISQIIKKNNREKFGQKILKILKPPIFPEHFFCRS